MRRSCFSETEEGEMIGILMAVAFGLGSIPMYALADRHWSHDPAKAVMWGMIYGWLGGYLVFSVLLK